LTLQIIQVSPTTVEATDKVKIDMPAVAYIGVDDGEIVGSFGLAWGGQRCWLWLRLEKGKPSYALTVMRRAKALIRKAFQLGEREIYTPRDSEFKTSEKLLTRLGFHFYATENDIEVWRYTSEAA
jgi:hypothetical protein